MRLWLVVFCWFCLFPSGDAAGAAPSCLLILAKVGEKKAEREKFWRASTPQKVGDAPFAFSFDAELWHATDMIRLVSSHPNALALARKSLEQAGLTFSPESLARQLRLRPPQKLAEFLRPESMGRERLTLLDLTAKGLERVKDTQAMKKPYAEHLLWAISAALEERNLPVTVAWESMSGSPEQGPLGDGGTVELKVKGSFTSPEAFRSLVKDFLHGEMRWPETHFHLSVPSNDVTHRQMMLAARAMEMKITLEELVAELKYDGTLSPHDHSALAQPLEEAEGGVDRGVVRVEIDRWDEPVAAHDVEFRQWLSADHALENMRFFMKLVTKRRQLLNTSNFESRAIRDIAPANLHSSLKYAAYILRRKYEQGPPLDIARELYRFAGQIEQAKTVTPEMRKEMAKYLKDNQVLSYFTLETFLK